MKSIAFITTMAGVPWGGSEVLWSKAASFANDKGYKVLVVVFDWSLGEKEVVQLIKNGVTVISRPRIESRPLWRRLLLRLGIRKIQATGKRSWAEDLLSWGPEAICVSQGNTYEVLHDQAVLDVLARLSVPVTFICQLNSEFHVLTDSVRAMARSLFDGALKVAFVAEANKETAERQLAVQFTNATVIRNPVNLTDWSSFPEFPYKNDEETRFAVVARLDVKYKGHDLLLKVLAGSEWKNRRWSLRLYGDGKDRNYIQELIESFHLQDRVILMGHVADVRSIWAENQVLILPSRAEGTPLSLIEAMLMGRTAVVTDVGGNLEWITDGETGFAAEGFTVRSIGNAMERAWKSRGNFEQMGLKARSYAMNHIDPDPERTLLNIITNGVSSNRDAQG